MASKTRLANGVQIVFEDNRHAAELGLVVAFRGGRMHEPRHRAGLEHFMEHLVMDTSSKAAALRRLCIMHGGTCDGETSSDMVMMGMSSPRRHFFRIAEALCDAILHPEVSAEELANECRAILQEQRRGFDETPERLELLRDRLVYGQHPIGDPVIGLPSNLRRFTVANFERLWTRRLDPRTIIITVVGQVDRRVVRQFIADRFGHLEIPTGATLYSVPRPKSSSRRSILVTTGDHQIMYAWIIRLPFGYSSPKRLCASVISRALGGHTESIIHRALRNQGLAYDVSSETWREPTLGHITLYSDTGPDDVRKALDAIQRRLGWLRSFNLPQDHFALAKADSLHTARRRHVDPFREGRLLAGQLGRQRRLSDHQSFMERLRSLTKAEVDNVLREILIPKNYFLAAIGPMSDADKRWIRRMFKPLAGKSTTSSRALSHSA